MKGPIDLRNGPMEITVRGPLDTMQPPNRQIKSSITWLGPHTSDVVESFSVSIAMALLMNGFGSPLYQGLIETGIGTNFSPNSGYDASASQGVLSIGLDGMKSSEVPDLRSIVQSILNSKSGEAFQPYKIEGYMHQLEIALKHKTPNFGMGVMEKTLPGWFNGVDPLEGLAWNETIAAFRDRLKQPQYLERLVEKYFQNVQCLQFTMQPWEGYEADINEQEAARRVRALENVEKQDASSEAAMASLGRQELELLHEQETAQTRNIEKLPSLQIDDVSRQLDRKAVQWATNAETACLWRETATNGLTYFQFKHLFNDLPNELRLLVPLFADCLMRLGTRSRSVGDLEAEILLKTGGITIAPFSVLNPWDTQSFTEGLSVEAYALDKNVPAMLSLIRETLLEVDLSSSKAPGAIMELLESRASGALDAVAESGNKFATSVSAASLSRGSYNQEQLTGLSQVEYVVSLLQAAREDPSSLQGIIEGLKMIQSISISHSRHLACRTVCEPSQRTTNEQHLRAFFSSLPGDIAPAPQSLSDSPVPGSSTSHRAFFDLPFQVSYTGTCLQTAPYGSPDKAPLSILSQLLTHNYLHPEVREKGGAYGASASAGSVSPLFTMSSYRDPNPCNSLKTFSGAGRFARDREWSPREIGESKLSLFQAIDAPTSPMSDGSIEFMYGITEDMRQKTREQLLDVTKEDVQRVANKYLVNPEPERQAVCLLGPKKPWIADDVPRWDVKRLQMATA